MPTVTIDDRTVEVPAGTNLVEAARQVGIQIPHYCYHPRLSIVGQCRMCLVQIQGMPRLQAACSTPVVKDGMVVRTDLPEVRDAQRAIMEFLLINHPLDCPICDQAGECGLQDYSFKHGQAFSRFRYEDKRTYPEKERIPLGPHVILNMNRCIQCTRCVRFTHEITKTGELGFFERGSRAEIGIFPGKPLDNPLSACVVDICPVGALTSTRFRFAERVWYLDKKPSLCTGCDVGCNVTIEHRRGKIRRYKPRFNADVNDYWMCDFGRTTPERYEQMPRLATPLVRRDGESRPVAWKEALDLLANRLRSRSAEGTIALLGSGFLTTEEAFLLASLADQVGSPHRSVWVDSAPARTIPTPGGLISGRDAAPNRRGAELAGLRPGPNGIDAEEILLRDGASRCSVLFVADSDFGRAAHDPKVVERLRSAQFLAVMGWADTPLAAAADLVLPTATHAEREGTFVNVGWRLQRFERAFPAPGQARPGTEVLVDLISRFDPSYLGAGTAEVFTRMAERLPAFAGLAYRRIAALGQQLDSAPVQPGAAGAAR
ncbi:MAG: molybdopterin-dependent oxidoreductase [Holophagales bacterium]|nr:MAG: molybdopterin-dependent oxidoreductase [Holophagales bacterium]